MDAREIKDENSFKAWLEALPTQVGEERARQIAVWLASRAALRVLPIIWKARRDPRAGVADRALLFVLRALLISWLVGSSSAAKLKLKVFRADSITRGYVRNDVERASEAAIYAADTSDWATDIDFSYGSSVSFAVRAVSAAGEADPKSDWRVLSIDAENSSSAPNDWRLWPDEARGEWRKLGGSIGADWQFWIDWYDSLLAGGSQNWDMLTEIALINDEHWDAGPDVVNPMIAEIQAKYAIEATPNAELLERDPADRLIRSVPIVGLDSDDLGDVRDRIGDAIEALKNLPVEGNMCLADMLENELQELESYLAKYKERPLRLYEVCIDVCHAVEQKTANGILPDKDEHLARFSRQLERSATDILANDEHVAAKVKRRASVRFSRMNEAEKAALRELTKATAQESKPELAAELNADLQIATGDVAPQEKADDSRYQLGSRLLRATKLKKDEVVKLADDAGKINKGAQAVGEGWNLISMISSWFT